MHQGYYIEENLCHMKDTYTELYGPVFGNGLLKTQYEGKQEEPIGHFQTSDQGDDDNDDDNDYHKKNKNKKLTPERRRHICHALQQVMVSKLLAAISAYAKHECEGCKIDHPSQTAHEICLWTTPSSWVEDYGYDKAALSCLNIYDIIYEWNNLLLSINNKGLLDLSPVELVEAHKNWTFF